MGYFFFFKVELKMFQPDKIDKMLLIAANNASISFYYLLGGGLNGPDRYLKLVTIQYRVSTGHRVKTARQHQYFLKIDN